MRCSKVFENNTRLLIIHAQMSGIKSCLAIITGILQGFKGKPQLGEYVWRYVPGGPPARVVADGFERPNGLAISADQHTMYVSDTGLESGNPNQVDFTSVQVLTSPLYPYFSGCDFSESDLSLYGYSTLSLHGCEKQ